MFKKTFILLSIFIFNFIFAPLTFAQDPTCSGSASIDTNKIRVRLAEPVNLSSTEDLRWIGTYCGPASDVKFSEKAKFSQGEEEATKAKIKECVQFEFPYDTPCPKTCDNKKELVSSCQLYEILSADSAGGFMKKIISKIYVLGVELGSIVAVLIIIISGIQYITAAGDSGKVTSAKERIMQALIALVVLLLSGIILYTINPTFFVK
ncbi:hypothetical protein A2483_04250 [Candidatus Peregrinibacteria bacterium RIFOXYC2_FULL_33_13]|nr:MAG: hypothetical protein UR30_C0016G0008 [Candidatus Peregrinibacteria bacterium GW2011_GWC2_33_13]OGJ49297.1 MAG: hypothetical protein A2229_01710 [Candidatus Peregrinibacteria bacterium RIFOXYA2_FULL_33_7]OGJ52722.1 MAG: hypothetical protein A2483_04250 [Candidatus Peregrinibacteria bacterium RIFOXYC2_FULL_33_13]